MKRACQHHKASASPGFTRPGATKHYPPDSRVEPVHMHLELRFDLEAQSLEGTNTITVRGNGGSGHTLTLNAVAFTRAEARGDGVDWFRYDGKQLVICWETPLADGEERKIEVPYRVDRPVAGLYFSQPSAAYPDAAWFAATDSESELARHWMPCVDLPHVRPKLSFALCAEQRFTCLANGAHAGEEVHPDGMKTVRWKLDHPCPSYLTCIAIGEFIEVNDGEFEGIPIAYYATKEFDEDHVRRGLGRTKEALEWMTEKLGVPFPYPKYFQFALPGFGGAMENISLVSWDDFCLMDEALASEMTIFVDQVNVHEMAHSYFGDLVVCRDFAHAWLKESWATYMECCWYEDKLGPEEFAYELYQNAGSYFRESDKRYKRPIVTREFNSSWQMYDMHLYPGGACRLHTLRKLVGDDVFWKGVTLYLNRYAEKTVETDHFRIVMEEVSGRSLVKFFDQWFHSKGYPNLKVIYSYDAPSQHALFTVEQEQWDTSTGVPLFDLDLEIGWTDADGKEHSRMLHIKESKETFGLRMESTPAMVRVDPHMQVLHALTFNPGADLLKTQLTDAKDPVGRILAARELCLTGLRPNIEAVVAAYDNESFWGVRVEIAKVLGETKTRAGVAALPQLVLNEEDPRALEKVILAVRGLREPEILQALLDRAKDDLPPRARRALYDVLGGFHEDAPLDLLIEASKTEGYHGYAQSGALLGLGQASPKYAHKHIRKRTKPGKIAFRARAAAVTALGRAGLLTDSKKARRRIVNTLCDRMRDPNERVQLAAARALAAMKATESITEVEKYANTLAHQDTVTVMKLVDGLRKEARKKAADKNVEVAKLRSEVKALRETVDLLKARIES